MTIPFLDSPNHASRNGVKITDIVLHWMDGTLAACDATFANAAGQTSAHYGVENTVVHQYVQDADVAWHSGDWNENQRSIGIEHSAQPGRDASAATVATSVALIVGLCRKYGISPDHIYPHNRFFATACPGTLPIAAIIAAVRVQLGNPTSEVPDMDVNQAAQLAYIAKFVGLALDTKGQIIQGELLTRVRSIDTHTAKAVDFAGIIKAALAAAPAGTATTGFTVEALAKAVNDDAAKRMVS